VEEKKRWNGGKRFLGEPGEKDLRRIRTSTKKRPYNDVKNLWDLHYNILRLISLGFENKKIAEQLGITPYTVSMIKNSTLGRRHLMILRGARDAETIDLMKRIKEFAPKCLDLLEDTISGEVNGEKIDTKFRVRTAEKYINRIPEISPSSRKGVESVHYTAEDMERIKQRARSAGVIKNVTPQQEALG